MRRCLSRRSPPTVHLLQEVSRHVGRAVLPRLTNLNQRRIPMLMGWSMPESLAQSQEIAINCNPAKPSQHAGKAQAKGHVRAMLHDVRSAHLAGKHKKAKHRIRRYLNSHHARLVAAELARRAMKVIADLHPHQCGSGNGGMHAAIKHVAQAMKDGFVWAVEMDLENCFWSFDADKVADLLPLPKEVTEQALLARNLNLVPGNLLDLLGGVSGGVHDVPYGSPHTPHFGPACGLGILGAQILAEARRGIPQGSAASPLLAEMLLAPALKQLPTGGKVFAYLDNFLIMAKSEDDAVSMAKALGCALKAHPAGPLRPKIRGLFRPREPTEFL